MADDLMPVDYLTRPALGIRRARTFSGRGTFAPGYRLVGEGEGAPSEDYARVNIVKMVSPLTGQMGKQNPTFYGRNAQTLSARVVRQARSVAPNVGSNVVRPPRTAIRRLNNAGQGVVGYY